MLEALILVALGGFLAGAVVTYLVVLHWDDIQRWFASRSQLVESDRDMIAFALKERLKSGKYSVVPGIFNRRNNSVVDGRKVQTSKLDPNLSKKFGDEDLAIFE